MNRPVVVELLYNECWVASDAEIRENGPDLYVEKAELDMALTKLFLAMEALEDLNQHELIELINNLDKTK